MTENSWKAVDLDAVLSGDWHPPKPLVGARIDGVGLFYPGKLHWVSAETEAGKTWLALAACAYEVRNGHHVGYIDFEDDENAIVGRLLSMQLSTSDIRTFFHYHRPIDPMTKGAAYDELDVTLSLRPTLVIIDGVAEAMGAQGLDPKDNTDIVAWQRILPRMIAQTCGAAVVCLDHVVKDREGRGRYAIGGVHKINGIDGAAYVLENRYPIGADLKGRSYIRIAKDRPGQLRKHATPGKLFWFGDLVVDLTFDGMAEGVVTVEPPNVEEGTTWKPTIIMARICEVLVGHPEGLSQTKLEHLVQGKTTTIREALGHLVADGCVTPKTPHKLLRPYVNEVADND